jgi:HEAT repeat protein/nucleoside phosphorylase/energy-coupling factor transporter ATP-binding protein EcfA2
MPPISAKPTIGVVTALPKEYAAVCVMLEEPEERSFPGDSSEYTIGKIPARGGGYNVVVVTLLKQMGNNSAALAATNLLRNFDSVEDVLMVGIASGIPQKGLRLGDVAVSNEKGVIQYDNVRRTDGRLEIRDTSGKPSARMIGKIKALEARQVRGERPWEKFIVRGEIIENGKRPSFKSDPYSSQADRQKFPKIHYGLIGSANTLLKNSEFRDSLAEQNVIAVEMEGSGIADGTWDFGKGYLLIRGICDYSDKNKSDEWQVYAAVSAAAYMRALIETIDVPLDEDEEDTKQTTTPRLEPQQQFVTPIERTTLILSLNKIGEERFETLLSILRVPTEYISGRYAGIAVRVSDLIRIAEAPGGFGLEVIRNGLEQIFQTNPTEGLALYNEAVAEGLLDQYREKLKKAIGTARFYGLPDQPLEKVFVELTVIEDFEIPRDAEYKALMDKELRRRRTLFPKGETEEDNPEEIDEENRKRPHKVRRAVKLEELLEPGKRSQVVGAPGCGKTTLLRWLALQTVNTTDRLPVFIELKALKKAQFDTIDDNFSVFLFQQGVKRRFDRTDLTTEQFTVLETTFRDYYKAGSLVVLLDGLDEIAEGERHRLRAAVENYANHHEGGLTFIVSTRPYGYLPNFADLKAMEIEPLSDIQIENFLDHWCEKLPPETVKAHLRKNPNLRSLARFPFLLAFIAHLNSAGDIPRIELYQRIVEKLIVEIDKEKGVERFKLDDPFGALKHDFLRKVAFDGLFKGNKSELSHRLVFTRDAFLKAAKEFVRQENLQISPAHLVFDVCATPLLCEVENQRYAFAHLTIQEFLAAEELSKHKNDQKITLQAFFNWRLAEMEVLPMAIGLADEPNKFYELLSKTPESFDFIRLCLEGRSLGYHSKQIQSIYYRRWEEKIRNFSLEQAEPEFVFSEVVLNSFSGIENQHFRYLTSGLLIALRDKDREIRRRATDALVFVGAASPDVIAALSEALRDQDSYVRRRAVDALASLSPASPFILTGLLLATRDQNNYVRQNAAEAIGKIGATSPDAILALSDLLRDQDSYVRQSAAEALGKLGIASPEITSALSNSIRDQDIYVRQRAAEALVSLGFTSPNAVNSLFIALYDQVHYVRQIAAQALGKIGAASIEIIAVLIKTLKDQDPDVRESAAEALGKLGTDSPEVIATLSNYLHDPDNHVRQLATKVLGELQKADPEIIFALSNSLKDHNNYVRQNAAEALGKLGSTSIPAITTLSAALQDENSFVRLSAAEALAKLGVSSPDVVATLSNALEDKNWEMKQRATRMLGELKSTSPEVVEGLSKILRDENWDLRQSAADALGKLGIVSPEAVIVLSNALRDEDTDVRRRSAGALVQLGAASSDAVVNLSNALRDQDRQVRRSAAEALGELGVASPDVILALTYALRNRDLDTRIRAAKALGKLGYTSPSVINALNNSLRDQASLVRLSSAESLGKLGANSPDVITALINTLRDRDLDVRLHAAETLERIGVNSPEFREGLKFLLSNPDPELQKMALRSIGYPSTDPGLLDDLKTLMESDNPEIREAAEDAHRRYRFKLEMLGLLPA